MLRNQLKDQEFSIERLERVRDSFREGATDGGTQDVQASRGGTTVGDGRGLFASDRRLGLSPADRHFLFVTGPFGPLSGEVARRLRGAGARATRVLLSVGDLIDWGIRHCAVYRGERSEWKDWLADHFGRESVTDLVVFGDSHTYCVDAMEAAKRHGITVHVLEEGYFRPHWITLERDGVNGMSGLPRGSEFYRRTAPACPEVEFVPVGRITPAAVAHISAYHFAQFLAAPLFPHYRAPSAYSPSYQAVSHTRRFLKQKLRAKRYDRDLRAILMDPSPIFLALLQRPGDSQLIRYSEFGTVESFIEHVVSSFSKHAPPEARLLFKAHPLDHGIERHDRTLDRVVEAYGLADRGFYTDVGHFPSMVRSSVGVISVNSTGGLTAIESRKPTAALGMAIYNIPGLTHQGGLDSFWTAPEAPDDSLFRAFRTVVIAKTQINGAYSTSHGVRLAAPEVARRLLA